MKTCMYKEFMKTKMHLWNDPNQTHPTLQHDPSFDMKISSNNDSQRITF